MRAKRAKQNVILNEVNNLPLIINPGTIKGTITAPPSKSMRVRAAAAMALAGIHPTASENDSEDVRAAVRAANEWLAGEKTLHVGESALAANIFSCIAALSEEPIVVVGERTLLKRDMSHLRDALRSGYVRVPGAKFPFTVRGPLRGGQVSLYGRQGSQAVTGLLMALPLASCDTVLEVSHPTSIPYIYMTLDLLAKCGIEIVRTMEENGLRFFIRGGQKYFFPTDYFVEGDWSGASCLLVGGDVTVRGLSEHSLQADRAIVDALRLAGADVAFDGDAVTVRRGEMRGFRFDATNSPDIFPALVALAASCKGWSRFRGAARLLNKESSRGQVLQQEYGKMGVFIDLDGDVMRVHGGRPRGGATVDSHGDHRIAMSLAVAAARALEPVTLLGADVVNKSYPDFWRDFEILYAAASS